MDEDMETATTCRHCSLNIERADVAGRVVWFDRTGTPGGFLTLCPERGIGLHHEPVDASSGSHEEDEK